MKYFVLIFILFAGTSSCKQKTISDRERELQDQKRAIDIKTQELNDVAGDYKGKLKDSLGSESNIKLHLEIKEVPNTDGVLVPILIGYLRIILGDENKKEYIDCATKTTEYKKSARKLSVVVTHAQFNEMVIDATENNGDLNGNWSAPSIGTTGTLNVSRYIPSEETTESELNTNGESLEN